MTDGQPSNNLYISALSTDHSETDPYMMTPPRALVLRAPGTNCDHETAFAFETAGAPTERLHLSEVRAKPSLLKRFQILVIPGGFSFGDDAGAGAIFACQLRHFLGNELRAFRDAGNLVLGICNGFQVLVRTGLLLLPDDEGPLISLTRNTNGRFEDRWVHLRARPGKCPFLAAIDRMHLPMAHGEGRFITRQEWILQGLEQAGQVVLRYTNAAGVPADVDDRNANPNGSQGAVAGLCDATGQVFGLMPHPERHVLPTQHPRWTREGLSEAPDGLQIFRNAVASFT